MSKKKVDLCPWVDWIKVREAMRRAREGCSKVDDQQLCEKAFKADKSRYAALHTEVVDEINAELYALWSGK